MGHRTSDVETINIFDAHMNSRCGEDGECDKCKLGNTYINNDNNGITYCDALSYLSEKFFIDISLQKGEKHTEGYVEKVNNNFNKIVSNG